MPMMRVAQIAKPGSPFELVERPLPEPGPEWIRIKVQACGVCHSDSLVKEGHWPQRQLSSRCRNPTKLSGSSMPLVKG